MLDSELLERAPRLRQMPAVDLAAGLGGVEIVRAAVARKVEAVPSSSMRKAE